MHPNAELLEQLDRAQQDGDLDAFFAGYTDDVIFHIGGSSSLAGEHRGKEKMKELMEKFVEAAGGYVFEPHAHLADDEHGVVLQRGHFERDGRSLDVSEAFIFHFRDGKISEFWYLPVDQAGVDSFLP